MNRTLCLLALLGALLASPSARAQQCDFSQYGWMDPVTSMDNDIIQYWCSSNAGANRQYYWDSLYLGEEEDYWDQPLDCADPNQHYIRMLNAAASLQAVHRSLQNTSLPDQATWAYNFLDDHVWPRSTHGYDTTCECCGTLGSNPDAPSTGATTLYYQFFWSLSAPERACVLVHEATHDDVGHESDDYCDAGGSCDTMYGAYNAQTMEIYCLDQAIRAYQKDFTTNQLKVANLGKDVCGWLPFLSPAARESSSTRMRTKLDNNFYGSYFGPASVNFHYQHSDEPGWGGHVWDVDEWGYARWGCAKFCTPSNYKGSGAKACNEQYQDGNAAINQANYDLCTAANAKLPAGLTQAQYHQAMLELYYGVKACIPGVSDAYLAQYCTQVSAGAANVNALEAAWQLPDQPGYFDSEVAMIECQRTYCDNKFQTSWVQTARTACYEWDDPSFGCMKELCGDLAALKTTYGDTSKEYFMAVQCRRHYIENGGDSQSYFDYQHPGDVCRHAYVECKNSLAYDAWAKLKASGGCSLYSVGSLPSQAGMYSFSALADLDLLDYSKWSASHPAVPIDKCVQIEKMCDAARALAAKVVSETILASKLPYAISKLVDKPNPSPYDKYRSPVDANMRGLAEIAAGSQLLRGKTPKAARQALATTPEMLHSLSLGLGKNNFFAAFGTKDLARVFGGAVLTKYAGAQVKIDDGADAALKSALGNLDTFRKTRERCESQATADLFSTAAAKLTGAQLFGLLQGITKAGSASELEAALDQVAAAVK
jgi:hypothetical protein